MVREHLTFPKRGSAYEIYTDILAKNPGSEAATRGLESIVEQYIQLSLSALDRRQFASARSMLARARLVLPEEVQPGHPLHLAAVEGDGEEEDDHHDHGNHVQGHEGAVKG